MKNKFSKKNFTTLRKWEKMTMDFEKEFDYHKKHPFQSCGVLQNGQ